MWVYLNIDNLELTKQKRDYVFLDAQVGGFFM